MNRQEFIDALRRMLSDEGFPTSYVDIQCNTLDENLKSLPADTEAQYTTARNLDILVRKLISQDGNLIQKPVSTPQSAQPSEETPPASAASAQPPEELSEAVAETPAKESDEIIPEPVHKSSASSKAKFTDDDLVVSKRRINRRPVSVSPANEYTPCRNPKLLTVLLLLICAPSILLFLTAAFGLFGGVFIVLAASIFFIVIAIIGIVGVGSVLSIASLLYGATQILSTPRYVGFHEIGFGLIVAGITMASSILLYNLAIRWIPFISQQMGKLFKLFFTKLINFAKNAVKGCEQL